MPTTANPSRRSFLQRTGLAAVAGAGVATALMSQPSTAHACTPIPPWLRDLLYEKLVEAYRPVEEITMQWMMEAKAPTQQFLRLSAIHAFIDDFCGTYPKWPPFPPRPTGPFLPYEEQLAGFDKIASATVDWVANAEGMDYPGILALHLLRDQMGASLGIPVPEPEEPVLKLWKGPHPC